MRKRKQVVKEMLSFVIETDYFKYLDMVAEERNVTRSELLRIIVKEWVKTDKNLFLNMKGDINQIWKLLYL